MKHFQLSFIHYQLRLLDEGKIPERDGLQAILDLCVERIVDLDNGRNDECITDTYSRSDLAGVLIQEELCSSADADIEVLQEELCSSADTKVLQEELCKSQADSQSKVAIDRSSMAVADTEPFPFRAIAIRDDDNGDSFTIRANRP
jgi:hypothetical protein